MICCLSPISGQTFKTGVSGFIACLVVISFTTEHHLEPEIHYVTKSMWMDMPIWVMFAFSFFTMIAESTGNFVSQCVTHRQAFFPTKSWPIQEGCFGTLKPVNIRMTPMPWLIHLLSPVHAESFQWTRFGHFPRAGSMNALGQGLRSPRPIQKRQRFRPVKCFSLIV